MKYRVKQSIVKDAAAIITFECGLCCVKHNSGHYKDTWSYHYVPNNPYQTCSIPATIECHPDKDEIKKAIESHFGNDEEFRETFG